MYKGGIIYKVVFILGARLRYAIEELKSDQAVFHHPDFLLIGDGENLVNVTELSILKGKVNSDTAIVISTHGSVFQNKHSTHLFAHPKSTYGVLELIQSLNPLVKHNVFLDSCYSGYATKDAVAMRDASVLVTYSKNIVYGNIFSSLKKFMGTILTSEYELDPIKLFMNNLYDHLCDEVAFTFVRSEMHNTKLILIKLGHAPYYFVKKAETFKIAPDMKALHSKVVGVIEEQLVAAKDEIADEYKIFFENALSGVEKHFIPHLSKLLIYHIYNWDVKEFQGIINFCKSYQSGLYLGEVLQTHDEFFNASTADFLRHPEYASFVETVNMPTNIFYQEPQLADGSQHDECFVI